MKKWGWGVEIYDISKKKVGARKQEEANFMALEPSPK